jgi:elongation factor G
MTIEVPEAYAGAVMGDISSRADEYSAWTRRRTADRAQAPYAEVVHYSPTLRSLSHGTGCYH